MVLRSRQNRASPADVIRFLVSVKSVITKIVDKSQSAKAERTKAPRYPFFSCLSKVFFTLHKLTKQPITCCSACNIWVN